MVTKSAAIQRGDEPSESYEFYSAEIDRPAHDTKTAPKVETKERAVRSSVAIYGNLRNVNLRSASCIALRVGLVMMIATLERSRH